MENKPCPICGDPTNHCYPCPKCSSTVTVKNEMYGICSECYLKLTDREAYELERQFYMGDIYYPPYEEIGHPEWYNEGLPGDDEQEYYKADE